MDYDMQRREKLLNKFKKELFNLENVKYDMFDIFSEAIITIDFYKNMETSIKNTKPSLRIFVNDVETIVVDSDLSNLSISLTGIKLDNFFIKLSLVKDIQIKNSTITIYLEVEQEFINL